jgi:lipopolysaccharide exporter
MISGAAWMIAMRWSVRGFGLLSTMILARILMPADFGLMAMASILVGLLEILSNFGVDIALIRTQEANRGHFDTAWSIQILQGIVVSALLALLAPVGATFFKEPRVTPLVRFLAIGMLAGGFTNIGVVAFRKDLNFSLEFWFSLWRKLLSFVVTVGLALVWRSYWALAAGIVTGQIAGTVLSYLMHPFRPKFTFSAARELWSFSQWMLLINIGNYSYEKGDEMVVGALLSPRDMGVYTVGYELSNLPTTEMLFPISRALFPGYARLLNEPRRLVSAYLNVLSAVATLCIPAGLGIAACAGSLTPVLLGEKWGSAVPVIQWLAFYGVLRATYSQAGNVLLALGHARVMAVFTWLQIVCLIPGTYMAGRTGGTIGIAIVKLGVASVFALLLFSMLIRYTSVTAKDIVRVTWRPAAAGTFMALGLHFFHLNLATHFSTLLVKVTVGAALYISALLILWVLSSKPSGIEHLILGELRSRFVRSAGNRESS